MSDGCDVRVVGSVVAETVTNIVTNVDGSASYTNEAGVIQTIPADIVTTIIATGANTYEFTNEAGAQTVIQFSETATNVNPIAGEQNQWRYTNEVGAPFDIIVDYQWASWPVAVPFAVGPDDPGSAGNYIIDNKPTFVRVPDGQTGDELWGVKIGPSGVPVWSLVF